MLATASTLHAAESNLIMTSANRLKLRGRKKKTLTEFCGRHVSSLSFSLQCVRMSAGLLHNLQQV